MNTFSIYSTGLSRHNATNGYNGTPLGDSENVMTNIYNKCTLENLRKASFDRSRLYDHSYEYKFELQFMNGIYTLLQYGLSFNHRLPEYKTSSYMFTILNPANIGKKKRDGSDAIDMIDYNTPYYDISHLESQIQSIAIEVFQGRGFTTKVVDNIVSYEFC